jgi:tagatose 1,6-diphosphate aldolase
MMSTAELRGYQQICQPNGAIMTIACDQRGGIRALLSPDRAEQAKITDAMLGDIKIDVVRHLASHAPSVLLDAVCAVPRVIDEAALPRDVALLIGLDASGYDTSPEGHRQSLLSEGIDARRVRALGAVGGKLMVYLRPDRPEANVHNLAILNSCVKDFADEGVFLVVEFLTYQLPEESADDYNAKLSELIIEGSRMCIASGAKVLKIPYPGSAAACAAVTEVAGEIPWAVLSAGVDHETFMGQVVIALDNGASGVIAGRSLWKDCIFWDRDKQQRLLATKAVARLAEIQAVLARHPRPLTRERR